MIGGMDGILLTTKVVVLISYMSGNSSDFDIEALEFFAGMHNLEVGVKCKAACRSSPWVVTDILSSITKEVEVG